MFTFVKGCLEQILLNPFLILCPISLTRFCASDLFLTLQLFIRIEEVV